MHACWTTVQLLTDSDNALDIDSWSCVINYRSRAQCTSHTCMLGYTVSSRFWKYFRLLKLHNFKQFLKMLYTYLSTDYFGTRQIIFGNNMNTIGNLPSDLVQKMVSYSIHVIAEYNLSGSKIIHPKAIWAKMTFFGGFMVINSGPEGINRMLNIILAGCNRPISPSIKWLEYLSNQTSTSWQCNTSGNHLQPATYGDKGLKR